MISIKNKTEKISLLRSEYEAKHSATKTFSEFVEWKSKTDPEFFRWLTGNRQIADYGATLSNATRAILLGTLGY